MSHLLQNTVNWVRSQDAVVSVEGAGLMETFAWETEPGYVLHLLNYTNPNATHGAIRQAYPLGPQKVRFHVSRAIKSVNTLRAGTNLVFQQQGETVSFEVPAVTDYEVVVLT
jgi:pyruvate formate-lyase activating enzyme-like uncharacterized protein